MRLLRVLQLEVQVKVPAGLVSSEALSLACRWLPHAPLGVVLLLCTHAPVLPLVRLQSPSDEDTSPIELGLIPVTSFNFNFLFEGPVPSTATF